MTDKITIHKMEDLADFIGGYWVIKPEFNNKEVVFACDMKGPMQLPDNMTITVGK